MSSQSSHYSSEPYNCNRCLKLTVVKLSKTKQNPGRKFYTCPGCNQWMGWCDNTANLCNVSLNPHMQQPYRQVAIYRNEAEVSSILNKQLAVLIVICVLILIMICFFYCFVASCKVVD